MEKKLAFKRTKQDRDRQEAATKMQKGAEKEENG
jgi:hypothetical protein